MSQIPTKAREQVWERQNRQCARCGAKGSEIHHRMRRREGGHGVHNLVGLCGTCHRWVHANPVEAQLQGYIIHISCNDIEAVELKSFMGWVQFTIGNDIVFVSDN